MLFIINCSDKRGGIDLRLKNRPAHLAYIDKYKKQIITAGAKLDSVSSPIGSLLIMEFKDIESARIFVDNDPYNKAGLFTEVSITHYRQVLPFMRE